jgi:fumarate reductase subunit C
VTVRLYLLQRWTAAILAPLIIGHLVLIFYATRQGLSAAEILGRTRGSIGLRSVLHEWGPARLARSERALDAVMWAIGLGLVGLGLRAVVAVIVGV